MPKAPRNPTGHAMTCGWSRAGAVAAIDWAAAPPPAEPCVPPVLPGGIDGMWELLGVGAAPGLTQTSHTASELAAGSGRLALLGRGTELPHAPIGKLLVVAGRQVCKIQ